MSDSIGVSCSKEKRAKRVESSQCCLSFVFPFQSIKLFVFNVSLARSSIAILLALNIKMMINLCIVLSSLISIPPRLPSLLLSLSHLVLDILSWYFFSWKIQRQDDGKARKKRRKYKNPMMMHDGVCVCVFVSGYQFSFDVKLSLRYLLQVLCSMLSFFDT